MVGVPVYKLVKKVIEPTGTMGKDGKPIKVTKYLPTNIVSYDEQKKQYVITLPDENTIVPPTTEGLPGSDFDLDKENAGLQVPYTEENTEEVAEAGTEAETTENVSSSNDLPW